MPLACDHDKETQIIWGIKDFEARFKRAPEGLWLAETACDTQTLMILAANGIKFTILAPAQCKKTRKIGDKIWKDESGAKVDPRRPYLCNLPNGKSIALFFYDGPMAQSVAFGGAINSGEQFANLLLGALDGRQGPQLAHIATDGETYGHHHRFGEMGLAYCLDYIEKNEPAQIINYGLYLEKFPPQHEAVINENTSWSCAHGIERWRADCGCRCGGKPGWSQKWRGPLRAAVDWARAQMLETFETKGKEYFYDIWSARNAYIDVILDDSKANAFLQTHGTPAARQAAPAAFKLMRMQLNAMLMYTSCGWFFDEISGLEPVQIMAYAKRAMGYNKALTGRDIEPQFITMLQSAHGNIPPYDTGAEVYERFVKPLSVGLRKAALNYAVSYLLNEILFEDAVYGYAIADQKVDVIRRENSKLVCGYAAFTSSLTTETRRVSFALLYNGGADITAGAGYGSSSLELKQVKEAFNCADTSRARELIKNSFSEVLAMGGLLKERQKQILASSVQKAQERVKNSLVNIFNQERPFLDYFKEVSFPVPQLILNVAEYVLNERLKKEIQQDALDEYKIERTLDEIKNIGGKTYEDMLKNLLTKRLSLLVDDYTADLADTAKAAKAAAFLTTAKKLALPVDIYKSGNIFYALLQDMPADLRANAAVKNLCGALNIVFE
jgi:hypothetical protein